MVRALVAYIYTKDMKRIPGIVFAFLLQFETSYSQADSLQIQINQQVWKPFIEAFNNLNAEAFMAVHSKQVARVIQDGNLIYDYGRYFNETRQGNENAKKTNQRRLLELRFIQRIAAGNQAFEVGYYKFTGVGPDGSTRHGYGKFHVLLRKEAGTWKILMDADSSEKADEKVFMGAKALE